MRCIRYSKRVEPGEHRKWRISVIELERTSVFNLENAMRGARNPMNSWNRMDSYYDENHEYVLGPNYGVC